MKNILILSIATLTPLCAQTVGWGTGVSSFSPLGINIPMAYDSTGTADIYGGTFLHNDEATYEAGAHTWSIGYFNDGYTPTASNWDTWASNFNTADTTRHVNTQFGWTVTEDHTPVTADQADKQIWTFVYNDTSLFGTSAGEALLWTDGQLFPAANTVTVDVYDSLDGAVIDDSAGFEIVWGRLDRDFLQDGGLYEGGGTFTGQPADNTFEAQTYSWGTPIPEPSSVALLALGGLSLITRRKRS